MDLLDTAVYDQVGEEGFARLVSAFYKQIPADDILGPMYGDHDLDGAETRLRDFLVQRFGGPDRYSQRRGHPRLRMRHAPYHVNRQARDRWIRLMETALSECRFPPPVETALRAFFEEAATFLINRP